VQLLMEIITAELPPAPSQGTSASAAIKSLCAELLAALAHVINLKVAPGKRLLKVIAHGIQAQGTTEGGSAADDVLFKLTHLLARLADCAHNKEVIEEQEHEVLPAVIPLIMFPPSASRRRVLSMALEAVHRFTTFGAIPSVLRRLNGTSGCISSLVRIVGGACKPGHREKLHLFSRTPGPDRVDLGDRKGVDANWGGGGDYPWRVDSSDRIHAARVLLKVAEGSGGIASLQLHEKELVQAFSTGQMSGQLLDSQLNLLMSGILHALVPTEAPYLRMLEHYEPPHERPF